MLADSLCPGAFGVSVGSWVPCNDNLQDHLPFKLQDGEEMMYVFFSSNKSTDSMGKYGKMIDGK